MALIARIRGILGSVFETLTGQRGRESEARLRRLEKSVSDANKRLIRLQRAVSDSRLGLRGSVRRIERELGAILRQQYVSGEGLPYPQRLAARRFRIMSQNEEDGIIYELVRDGELHERRFVELGCGANGGNSGFLARELGWKGLMVDADERKLETARHRFATAKVSCVQSWITRDNVDTLITDAGIDGEIGVLSIDIDGNDYWVWEAISACIPRVVVIEYNSLFGAKRSVAVPHDERFDRHAFPPGADGKAIYFGASLEALARLGRRKGYRLVAVEPRGVNAFFLRDGARPEIPPCTPRDCFRLLDKYIGHNLTKLVEEHDLPLVVIP